MLVSLRQHLELTGTSWCGCGMFIPGRVVLMWVLNPATALTGLGRLPLLNSFYFCYVQEHKSLGMGKHHKRQIKFYTLIRSHHLCCPYPYSINLQLLGRYCLLFPLDNVLKTLSSLYHYASFCLQNCTSKPRKTINPFVCYWEFFNYRSSRNDSLAQARCSRATF